MFKGKKDKGDAELAEKKSKLFGGFGRPKASKTTSNASNPYAAPAQSNDPKSSNPYATSSGAHDRYAAPSQSSLTQPPTSSLGNVTLNSDYGQPPAYRQPSPAPNRQEKSAVPQGGYGGSTPKYGASGSYGQASGYGNDVYGNGQSQRGAGGYGGLGRNNSQDTMDTDVGRSALFAGAAQRAQQQPSPALQQPSDNSYSNTGGYDSGEVPGGYNTAPAEEKTAEELENDEVGATKGQIDHWKDKTLDRSRNARQVAEQAEATARQTLERLGLQSERIHNTERNLDMAEIHNAEAGEKAKELKTLNRSMWALHMDNPLTKSKREQLEVQQAKEKRRHDRDRNEATAKEAYSTQARQRAQQRDLNGNVVQQPVQRNYLERNKYQFEADSDDDRKEDEIDDNMEALHKTSKTLGLLSRAMGEEIDSQNKHLDRIIGKTDKVDDGIAVNKMKLSKIERRG